MVEKLANKTLRVVTTTVIFLIQFYAFSCHQNSIQQTDVCVFLLYLNNLKHYLLNILAKIWRTIEVTVDSDLDVFLEKVQTPPPLLNIFFQNL